MAIQFNPDRWAQVRETFTKWWDGSLKRPMFQVTAGRAGTRPAPQRSRPLPGKLRRFFLDAGGADR